MNTHLSSLTSTRSSHSLVWSSSSILWQQFEILTTWIRPLALFSPTLFIANNILFSFPLGRTHLWHLTLSIDLYPPTSPQPLPLPVFWTIIMLPYASIASICLSHVSPAGPSTQLFTASIKDILALLIWNELPFKSMSSRLWLLSVSLFVLVFVSIMVSLEWLWRYKVVISSRHLDIWVWGFKELSVL